MFTTLRSKILAGFAAIITLNVAFGLWAIYQFSQVGESTAEMVASNYELVSSAVQLGSLVDQQFDVLKQMLNDRNRRVAIEQFEARSIDFRTVVFTIENQGLAAGKESVVAKIKSDFDAFQQAAKSYRWVVAGLEEGNPADMLRRSVQPAANDLKQECFNLLYKNPNEINHVRDQIGDQLSRALIFVAGGTVAAMLLGIIGGSFYARWIVRPIQRLTQAAKSMTGGRLGEGILITSNDELGDLSFEFNRMIERLRNYDEMNIEQLLLEKRKVETIVQSIATPIIVVDAEMRVLLINSAALDLFRLARGRNHEGVSLNELMTEDVVVRSLQRALDQGASNEAGSPDIYLRREEGEERFYTIAALPLATTSSVRGVVAVFSDITHFKELDRLKSEFLAKVSHEFRTPLSSIIMSLDILREGLLGEINEGQRDLLLSSKDDCRRLTKLIGDLLELSRMEARMHNRNSTRIEINGLLASVLKPHRLPAKEKGVELVEVISSTLPLFWGDPEEFRWLFNNLISNALRHTPWGGSVTVSVETDIENLVITVKDTGEGIPLDSLNRIFEKFHQIGSPAISTPGSIGLGLAIVKEVVESYGGRISVTSELHKGSCFTLRLPLGRLTDPAAEMSHATT